MKTILEKMIYAVASCAMVVAVVFTFSSSGVAQNHNPEFSVSNTFLGGEPYIFIGEDDKVAYPLRTPVELKYRDGIDVPKEGTVTLQWVTTGGAEDGSSRVLANDSSSGTGGFTDGENNTSESGPWTWVDNDPDDGVDHLADYEDKTIYLQGVADVVDSNGNVTSYAGNTVSLEATISDNPEKGSKDFSLLKVDLEIEDEHFTENLMDTSETDDDLEQFIMAREDSLNPDPFEITIRPSDNLAGISKTRYRLVSPNETGGVDETDGPFTAEVAGLAVNYHNDEPAELHVGIDKNNNNELDESEYLKTVPIHPLYWNVTGADSEQGLGPLQTVPSDVLLWEASGELASYLYDNQFKTVITGPVDGLGLIVRYTSTEDTDDWFEETIGSITPEGSKVADLEQVFYEFPGSEGGSGVSEQVLLSSGVRMIYSEPTAGGTRNPIDETIWNQLWSNYSYGVVHNDDVSIEIKREERPNIYKKVLEIPVLGGLVKKEGQALRQFHRVLNDRHGAGATPSDTTITVKEYDAFYKKLISGARAAGNAQYLSIVGVEEVGGFKGLAMSGDNMEWWVRGTQRTGYGQTGADGFPADYRVLPYQEFSSKSFIQERINKYLIGWPVKNSSAGTTLFKSMCRSSTLAETLN